LITRPVEPYFYIRNAKLEIPQGNSICIFALGNILQPVTGAIIKNKDGEGLLDVLEDTQNYQIDVPGTGRKV